MSGGGLEQTEMGLRPVVGVLCSYPKGVQNLCAKMQALEGPKSGACGALGRGDH